MMPALNGFGNKPLGPTMDLPFSCSLPVFFDRVHLACFDPGHRISYSSQAYRCHDILLKHAKSARKGRVFKSPPSSKPNLAIYHVILCIAWEIVL